MKWNILNIRLKVWLRCFPRIDVAVIPNVTYPVIDNKTFYDEAGNIKFIRG